MSQRENVSLEFMLQIRVHVDTKTNTSLLILDWESLEIFQSVQENFQSVLQRNIGPDPAMYLQSFYAPFGIYAKIIFS